MNSIENLQTAIRNILTSNRLTELCLGEPGELEDPTYIIWYDRHCEPNEDPVLKVCLEDEGIAVEVEARSFGNTPVSGLWQDGQGEAAVLRYRMS